MDNNFSWKTQSDQLKTFRGITQKVDYARKLGVSYRTYLRYEKGERKMPVGLMRLAKRLFDDEMRDKQTGLIISTGKCVVKEQNIEYGTQRHGELVRMVVEVLDSETGYAKLLAENIRSFHNSVEMHRKLTNHENRLETLEQVVSFKK